MSKRHKFTYIAAGGAVVLALQLAFHVIGPVAFAAHHEQKVHSMAFMAPIVEGQLCAWHHMLGEWGENPDAVIDFNERYGLTRHAGWLAQTPNGPVAIVLHEGPGAATFMQELATSEHEFDVAFRNQISKIHGIDFSAPPPGPPPALIFDSSQESVVVHDMME